MTERQFYVLIIIILFPVMAAPVAAQYRIKDDLDIVFGVGFDFFTHAIYGDVVANFLVGGFNIKEAGFDITAGAGVLIGLNNEQFELSVVAPVGITYKFPDDVISLDLYIRVGPSIRIFKGYQANVLGLYSYVRLLANYFLDSIILVTDFSGSKYISDDGKIHVLANDCQLFPATWNSLIGLWYRSSI